MPISRGKQRALLAALLLNANQVIPMTAIADALWGPKPPSSADMTIRNYVKRLRQALHDTGPDRISTHPHGYLMRADAAELDLKCCEELVAAARAAERSGDWEQTAARASAALALWRGTPLADVDSETLESGEGARLTELRLQILELRIDADLHLGRHAQVILELQRLRQEYPLRERPHALTMLALYRLGRQAEALDVYLRARDTLVTEVGLEPSPLLRDLHRRILTADPALGLPSAVTASSRATQIVPRELPGAVRDFVGREAELAQLTDFVTTTDQRTAPMAVIAGTAGVGKTALALHWAHLMADNFPDGQLYVDLCGYDFDQPKTATAVLATMLSALGVPREGIPAEEAERAARYRSLLAGRRILVLLDNARSVEQVRPMVPATAGCTALVTSRDAMAGLVARYGAMRIELDVLSLSEAAQLLRQLIGGRIDAEPGVAEKLALQCSRLPLALRIAAELCCARPAVPVSTLIQELADERPLDMLDARLDDSTRVRTVFNWSYRCLDPLEATVFRMAGLHPGADLDGYGLAALAGIPLNAAESALAQLARAYLLYPVGNGRFGMHDLLRAYARELADAHGDASERPAALGRLSGYYVQAAAIAMDAAFPSERHLRPRTDAPSAVCPPLPGAAPAITWLNAERSNIVAVVLDSVTGRPQQAVDLAATLFRYLDVGAHYPEAIAAHGAARRAAAATGDKAAEATALGHLSSAEYGCGRYRAAAEAAAAARQLFHEAGSTTGESTALVALGIGAATLGNYDDAARHFRQALQLYRAHGDEVGEARTLCNLGCATLDSGHLDDAADHLELSLSLFRDCADSAGAAHVLGRLGSLELRRGRDEQAAAYYRESLGICRDIGARLDEAQALDGLAQAHRASGDVGEARRYWQEALALYTSLGKPEADQVLARLRGC